MDAAADFQRESSEETMRGRYLTFQAGEETFGIPLQYVTEIVSMQPLVVLPEMPDCIRGVIDLRGKIVPAMDVRLRFGMPWREYGDRTCMIVVEKNGLSAGLIIDAVSEVVKIEEAQIREKPAMGASSEGDFISAIAKKEEQVILLVDCEKLLRTEALCALSDCR